ncbi:hypothetical protein Msub_12198 [Marinobacter subterrani]|uniref:Uncharacterized protein n=1 Tax=Marinobacter subterrani TaxID=1658765 RepID=A0A0J7JDN1_9GAMM|nr:hypothetical protein [Marinobacter subterrani]KMQ75989.1 hypothetical protein Msub_12198 [Marinobacter subterrani]
MEDGSGNAFAVDTQAQGLAGCLVLEERMTEVEFEDQRAGQVATDNLQVRQTLEHGNGRGIKAKDDIRLAAAGLQHPGFRPVPTSSTTCLLSSNALAASMAVE